jgi:hypothetical protein
MLNKGDSMKNKLSKDEWVYFNNYLVEIEQMERQQLCTDEVKKSDVIDIMYDQYLDGRNHWAEFEEVPF